LIGATSDNSITITPPTVTVILNGPLPTLNEIEADPELVQVLANASGLEAGQNIITPTVIAPEEINRQLIPPTTVVTLPANGENSGQELSNQ
jgi:hypothetical protein